MLTFNVTLDRDEDGMWIVECPAIPGCVSQGETKEEALENVKDAIAACLQVRAGEAGRWAVVGDWWSSKASVDAARSRDPTKACRS